MYPASITALVRLLGLLGAFPTRLADANKFAKLIARLQPLGPDRDFLRLGAAGDGGYLVPDDLLGVTSCWSAGVGHDSQFERDCANRGMEVFLADGSVNGPCGDHPRFHFTRKFIGAVDGCDTVTLESWVESPRLNPSADLMLKLDIEGAEYEVLLAAPASLLAKCRIVVVEFHQLDLLWSAPLFRVASRAFEKLIAAHACVHIHPNNHDGVLRHRGLEVPPTMEFTFLRRDRLPVRQRWRSDFPHPLDHDNTPLPTLVLPRCWYR